MGMFDRIRTFDDRLVCGEGHVLHEWQSKSLECNLDTYDLLESQLFREEGETDSGTRRWDPRPTKGPDGKWTRTFVYALTPLVLGHRTIGIHTSCEDCQPVYFVVHDRVSTGHPWVEYNLCFASDGTLVAIEPVQVQTRAEYRQERIKDGAHVLADDDPLVLRHVARLKRSQ